MRGYCPHPKTVILPKKRIKRELNEKRCKEMGEAFDLFDTGG
jgi:hypothetical protein